MLKLRFAFAAIDSDGIASVKEVCMIPGFERVGLQSRRKRNNCNTALAEGRILQIVQTVIDHPAERGTRSPVETLLSAPASAGSRAHVQAAAQARAASARSAPCSTARCRATCCMDSHP